MVELSSLKYIGSGSMLHRLGCPTHEGTRQSFLEHVSPSKSTQAFLNAHQKPPLNKQKETHHQIRRSEGSRTLPQHNCNFDHHGTYKDSALAVPEAIQVPYRSFQAAEKIVSLTYLAQAKWGHAL
ncbi:hypothetical protein DSO57_1039119 [Entomophthora muscae]|uniref:Uncharacterized protein n=1 Tax=Entomophthora muscae TaxID=34485 RepID=A0ACC2SB91_9FUNG|nr:hypothetical protein DSO57_1039119 [Entomophthora muscae]